MYFDLVILYVEIYFRKIISKIGMEKIRIIFFVNRIG